eukprot:TRINITY_DN18981_c0_g1_i1.p1 TRINITY_DN18981_c0_g1~~TRINITY_DN18981_c0_g1_i1.p1  ORF type:complete len:178 (+),score=28.04 TRINITY_DN18981_c0_g1_i1:50-583(+)
MATPVRRKIPVGNTGKMVNRIHSGLCVAELTSVGSTFLPFRTEEVREVESKARHMERNPADVISAGFLDKVEDLLAALKCELKIFKGIKPLERHWSDLISRTKNSYRVLTSDRSMPKRADPSTHKAYTLQQFYDFYGTKKGEIMWNKAEEVTRCPACQKNFLKKKLSKHVSSCIQSP